MGDWVQLECRGSKPMAASFVGQKELDLKYDLPLEANVIVGGNSDVVEMPISNKYVSRRHCPGPTPTQ